MANFVIIDDEAKARSVIAELLLKFYPQNKILAEATSVEEGKKVLSTTTPDAVFLDVHMPDGTGFDLLNQLSIYNFKVIFCTAFDKYALNAFKMSAIDYLQKPVNIEDFKRAVDKIDVSKEGVQSNKIGNLLNNMRQINSQEVKITLPTNSGLEFVMLKDILYCKALQNYTTFNLLNGRKVMLSKTLKEYDELLSDKGFFRIHQSYLVNMNYITKYVKGRGGRILLTDGTELEVSRNKKELFVAALQDTFIS